MARYRVVKLGHGAPPDIAYERERLAPLDVEVAAVAVTDEDSVVAAMRGAEGCIAIGAAFTASVVDRLGPPTWFIVHAGTGYDPIDVDAATARGIAVANLPFQCVDEVANSALAYILALNRRIVEADRHTRAGKWDRGSFRPIGPIAGETLGLLGFGNISRAMVKRGHALGMRVVAYDPFVDPAVAHELDVELVPLDELAAQADYVSCHLPHNRTTHHLLNDGFFRRMKPTAYFVNTARGRVVDEPALCRALQDGVIAGAGLDVFEVEPLPVDSPLLIMENVLLAPHLAGTSVASAVKNREQAVDQVIEAIRDGRPSALVNRDVAPRRVARV